MSLRILVTGFGTFPGAPYNPTPKLVARLVRLRRPALAAVELIPHIFSVSYRIVDDELPSLIYAHEPDALLMFGLAARTHHLRIETHARNAVTQLWPDAAQTHQRKRAICGIDDARHFGPHTARLLRAAKATGIDTRASRDAGSYLCNYLSWRALEACEAADGPRLAAFVHVPLTAHDGGPLRGVASRITHEQMVDAGEAILLEMVASLRRVNRSRE